MANSISTGNSAVKVDKDNSIGKMDSSSLAGKRIAAYASLYKDELAGNILPFWMEHSRDEVNGGYFTCLNRNGSVYDTDKFIWLQGRQIWCFSYMYHNFEQRQEWLDMAVHGAKFLEKYGRDANGDWYFSLTASGDPL